MDWCFLCHVTDNISKAEFSVVCRMCLHFGSAYGMFNENTYMSSEPSNYMNSDEYNLYSEKLNEIFKN